MFGFALLKGEVNKALTAPFSIVLSASVAKRYFGDDVAVGKTLHLKGSDEDHDYLVTGVMYDPPADSHLDADILVSASSLENNSHFKFFDAYTYVRLKPGVDTGPLREKLYSIANVVSPPSDKTRTALQLQPVTDIHLHSSLQDEIKPGGNARSIYF